MIASASVYPRISSVKGLLSIGQASRILGISQQTIRTASDSGSLRAYVLPSGHRRFALDDCYTWLGRGEESNGAGVDPIRVCIYARTSSSKQAKGFAKGEESDLTRQIETLLAYAKEHYGCSEPTVLKDVASGLSFGTARPAFNKLIEGMLRGEWSVVLCNFKDRLARFGVEIIEKIAEHNGIKIVYASDAPDKSSEEELTADLIAFTHVYSCRFYSKRSAEKLRVVPSTDVTKRILELSQQGHAARVIVELLRSEGLDKDSKGRLISKSVVQRILKESGAIKETIVGVAQTNSFGRFAQQHIKLLNAVGVKGSDATGLGGAGVKPTDGPPIQHKTLMTHYKQWCERAGEAPISNLRVGKYLAEQGVRSRDHHTGVRLARANASKDCFTVSAESPADVSVTDALIKSALETPSDVESLSISLRRSPSCDLVLPEMMLSLVSSWSDEIKSLTPRFTEWITPRIAPPPARKAAYRLVANPTEWAYRSQNVEPS